MLKFVSKKPPKGKQPMQSLDYPPESHQIRHINTRQYFRPRAFSSESGGPQVYDYHPRRDDKSFIHQSPVLKRHQVRHGSNSNIIRNGDENDNVPPEYMADLPPPHPHHHHHHQHTQHAHHYPPPPPNIFHPQGQYYQHHQQQNNSQQNNHQQQHHHHQQHQQQHHHQHFQQNGHSSMDSLDLSHEAISGIYSPDDTMSSEHPHHPHYPHFPQHHHPHGGLKKRSVEGEEHHRHRTGVSYRHVTWSPEVKDEGQRLDHLGHEDFEARRKFEATTVHEDPSMYREREQRARFYPVPMVQTGQLGHVDDLDYDNNNYSIDQVDNKSVDHKLNNSKNNNVFKPLSVTTSIFSSRSQNSPPIKSSCTVFVDTTQSSSIYVTPAVQSPQPGMEVRSYITPYGSIACHVTKTPSSTTTTTTDSKEEGDQSRTKHVNVEKKFLKEDEGPNDYDDTLGPLAPNGLFSNSNLPLLTSSPNQSESDINYAYYTTLPAKLSNYSNFVFSPYSFSTPKKTEIEQEMKYMKEKQRERTVDDASKVQETRTRLPSLSPTGQKDTKYLCKDVKDEDEYDNISMETDKVYYEKYAKPRFDQNLRENNSKHVKNIVSMAANHENTMETSHQGVQDTSTSLDSHLSSESTGTSVTRETVPEAATPSSSSSSGRKSNRGFPRLFLLQDRSDHRDKVSHDSSVASHDQIRLSHDQQVHVSDKQISGTNTLTSREAQSQGHITHHLHSQDHHPHHHQQQQHQQQQQQHHSHENIFSQGLRQLSKAFGRDNKHKHKHGSDSDSKTRMEGEEREVTTKEGVIPPVVPPRKISLDRFFYFTKALEKSRHGSDQKKQHKTSSKENSQEEMEMPVIYQQARKVQGPNNASERSRTVETHEYKEDNMSPKTREHPSFEEISRSSYDHSRSFGQGQPDVSSWSFQGHDFVDYSASDNTDYDHYADQYMKQYREDSGQVMTSCVPQTNHDLSTNDLLRRQYQFKDASSTSGSMLSSGNMSSMRDMINRSRDLNAEDGQLVLDLVYVTERLISMSFPSEGHEATYQSNLQEVMAMLRSKHGENCLVLNISEPRQDLEQWNPKHVIDYGWPDFLAPPLERLCNICKAMDSWLNSDPHHVVVIHCKGSNSRIALIVAAFMHYNSICASSDQALDRFAMKRFYEEKLGGISQPSQSRYVQYFHGLLSGSIKINSNALYLHHIVIHGVPNFDTNGGCRPFIKVYQGMQCIFTSGVYKVTDQMQKVCISISPGIPLRGDIMIKCFHKMPRTGDRESVWACQFHTCAIMGYNLVFAKKDLDDARTDPRFPDSGKVEFVFGNTQDGHVGVTDFKSDVTVPVDEQGETNVARRNSFENFLQTGVVGNSVADSSNTTSRTMKTTTTTTTSTINNNNNNNNEEKPQKGYNSSMNTSKSSYSSSSSGTKKTVPPLDEQTQLDLILSDLLNEQVFVTSPSGSKSGTNGSKETRTFRTYDTHTSPEGKTSYQAAEVTYKIPGGFREEKSYSMTKSEEKQAYVPPNAFSYTTSPELARKGYGPTSPELIRKAESPKTRTLPYRTDYDNRYYTDSYRTMESGGSLSPTDTSSSWLYEQQQKLRQRKDSKDEKTVEQERQLVEELKTAQNRFIQQKNQKQNEERVTMDTYHSKASSPPPVANGPTTTYNYQVSRSPTYFHHTSQGSVSSPLNTGESTTTYTYRTESKTTSSSSGINKAPPSPGLSRQIISPVAVPPSVGHVSAPVSPPIRSSSKDYMQRNRSTSTSSWQSGRSTYNKQNLVHEHEIRPPIVKSISITTPPLSPRLSPRQQHTVQSPPPTQHPPPLLPQQPAGPGTSYHVDTIQKINTIISEPMVQQHQIKTSHTSKSNSNTMLHHAPTKTKTTEVQEVDLKDGNKKSNYITEVYINRSPGRGGAESTSTSHTTTIERHVDRGDKESNRLDELEKTLQAASNSIMASQPWQQQSSANKSYSTMERHVTRRYETREVRNTQQQQQQSENKQIVSSNEKGFVSDVSPRLVQHQHHQQSMSPEFENRNRSMSPVWDNMHVSTSTIVTQQVHTAPPPKQISVVEEDRISLRPIGPGVTNLEPEGMVGTLGRSGATTPSFPISPVQSAVTPPFPVSPRTPYVNQGHPGSQQQQQQQQMFMTQTVHREHQETNQQPQQHFTHVEQHRETGNQQQQHHVPLEIQVQHQNPPHLQNFQNQGHHQEQHQQYSYHTQQQHHHSGSDAHRQGLHVDTSNRMVGHGMTARTPTSPPSPGSFNTLRQQLSVGGTMSPTSHSVTGQSSPSLYFGTSRRGSISSLADSEPSHITTPRFVRDTSKYWYKPHISREEAITMLKDKAPGAFVVRDSNSYPGAFGLALKVSQIPPNVQTKSTGDPSADLVRHFLIEPTHKGVRLRGSSNEPIFGSLASLVYQHSITPLSLPCKLVLPDAETIAADNASMVDGPSRTDLPGSPAALLAQGAACNVLYITSVDTESLTGPQAVSRAMKLTLDSQPLPKTTVVHFKVSSQGITLTDNQRKLFFRRHYPVTAVTYCGLDPEARKWRSQNENGQIVEAKVFGFIARKSGGVSDNACHLFAELDPEQPASAIVNFVSKVMIGHSKVKC